MSDSNEEELGHRRAVIVSGLVDAAKSAEVQGKVELYFQSRKSGGGDVEFVEAIDDSRLRVVFTKEDAQAAKRVSSGKYHHMIDDQSIVVELDEGYDPESKRNVSTTAVTNPEKFPNSGGEMTQQRESLWTMDNSANRGAGIGRAAGRGIRGRGRGAGNRSKTTRPGNLADNSGFGAGDTFSTQSTVCSPHSDGLPNSRSQQFASSDYMNVGASSVEEFPSSSGYQEVSPDHHFYNSRPEQYSHPFTSDPFRQDALHRQNPPSSGGYQDNQPFESENITMLRSAERALMQSEPGCKQMVEVDRFKSQPHHKHGSGFAHPEQHRSLGTECGIGKELGDFGGGVYEGDDDSFTQIEVKGLPPSVDKDMVEMHFESKKRSNGGDLELVSLDSVHGVALVTFADPNVAKRVCAHRHVLCGAAIEVVPHRPQQTRQSTQVWVSGIPDSIGKEYLEMYFDSVRKSGGEGLVSIAMGPGSSQAVITFSSAEVANRVCARVHKVANTTLTVTSEEPMTTVHPTDDFSNRLLVTNIPQTLSDDLLEMYFENKRRSGGGLIENLKCYPEYGTAVVTFFDRDAVKRICSRSVHKLKDTELQVSPYIPEMDPEHSQRAKQRTVRVTFPHDYDPDMLEMYFENTKRSGGGEIEKFNVDLGKNCIDITYPDVEVASRVASQSHQLLGKPLKVQLLSQSDSSESSPKDNEFEPNMALVLDVSDDIEEELLSLYMFSQTKVEVESVEIRRENQRALVVLKDSYDFESAAKCVRNTTLKNQELQLRQVPVCRTVRILNAAAANLNEEFVELYFQKGYPDINVVFRGQDADVTFPRPSDVKAVCGKEHSLNRHTFQLQPVVPGWDFAFPDESVPGDDASGGVADASAVEPFPVAIQPIHLQFLQGREESAHFLLDRLFTVCASVKDFTKAPLLVQPLPGVQKVFNWQQRAFKILHEFVGSLHNAEVKLSADALNEVLASGELEKRLGALQRRLMVQPDQGRGLIALVGHAEEIRKAHQIITSLAAEAEEELQNITQEDVRVRPCALQLMRQLNMLAELSNSYRHVQVHPGKKKGMLTVEGRRREVFLAASEIRKKSNEVLDLVLNFSTPSANSILTSDRGKEFAQTVVDRAGLEAVVTVKPKEGKRPPEMRLVGWVNNEAELEAMKEQMKDLVVERKMNLRPCETEAMQTAKWDDLVSLITETYLIKLIEGRDKSSLALHGALQHIEGVERDLQNFFATNAIISQLMKLEAGQVRYLRTYCRESLGGIEAKLVDFRVSVRLQKAAMEFRGTEQGVAKAKEISVILLNGIADDGIEITKPGMKKYFAKEEAKKLLSAIEQDRQVVIEQDAVLSEASVGKTAVTQQMENEPVVSVVTNEGKKVSIFCGDITQHQCDVIVNAANEELNHEGGVAKAIADAGGAEIRIECANYIQQTGRLLSGQVFAGNPGNLPCKRLVHAVGPRWSGGGHYESRYLQRAIMLSLEEAEMFSSVALPAISTGVFGYPTRAAAEIMVDAALEFSCQQPTSKLHDIQFVIRDEAIVKEFTSVLQDLYKDVPNKLIWPSRHQTTRSKQQPQARILDRGESTPISSRRKARGRLRRRKNQAAKVSEEATSPNTVQTAEGKVVIVQQGDLAKEKVDVIVNTAAINLDLQRGMVAKVLSKAAGSGLQKECSAYVLENGKVAYGDFAVTTGHHLHCQEVFHLVCNHYKNGDGVQTLHDGLVKCFKEADRRGHSSIALPSLGTGNLGFPATESAKTMFAAVTEFSHQDPSGSLQEIRFTIFDPNIVADFYQVAASQPSAASLEIEDGEEDAEIPPLFASGELEVSTAATADVDSPADISLQNEGDILCGGLPGSALQVHLFKGNIISEKSDAIVISANEDLDLNRGKMTKVILKAAGQQLQVECKEIIKRGKLKPGQVCSTVAGKLSCKYVIHAVCQFYDARYKSEMKKALEGLVLSALKEADNHGLTSVAVPALGMGIIGYPDKVCAEATLAGIVSFADKHAQNVQIVRLVLFEDKHVAAFQDEFKTQLTGVQLSHSDGPGILTKVGQWFNLTAKENPQPSEKSASFTALLSRANVSMWLRLYGPDKKTVSVARGDVEKLLEDKHRDKVFSMDAISCLTAEDIARVEHAAAEFGIDVDMEVELNRVRLRGDSTGVADACGQVLEIITNAGERARIEQHAEHMSKLVEWVRVRGSMEEKYDKISNMKLEDAYVAKKRHVEVIIKGKMCSVDLTEMEEHRRGVPPIPVKRNDLTKKEELPKTWSAQQGQKVLLVPLANTDAEYSKVEQAFKQTSGRTVLKIERVQNPELYKQYTAKKDSMETGGNVKNGANEKRLYHGSDATSATAICTQGFNRSYAGRHATAYGRGVYFAVNANYSENYAPADGNGHRHMFQVQVVAGDFCAGNSSMVAPPARNPSVNQVDLFDSTVDNTGSPAIYVTYNDAQTYPEYLITFQ